MTKGLSLTKMKIVDSADNQDVVFDKHGILCREYLPFTNTYDTKQLRIINKGLYLTDDGWETAKTGIGNFQYYNPGTETWQEGYGVIADTLVGNLILGKNVGIYNDSNSITMDEDGFIITANNNDNRTLFTVRKKLTGGNNPTYKTFISIDSNGNLMLDGSTGLNSITHGSVTSVDGMLGYADAQIILAKDKIKSTISGATSKYDLSEAAMQDKLPSVITDLSKVKFGYGAPNSAENNYAPADYRNKYYFDQETGQFYKSNGSTWSTFGQRMPLLTDTLALTLSEQSHTEIVQTAEQIKQTAAKAVSKFDLSGYNITLFGYEDPSTDKTTVEGYKASEHNGEYYLNQSNGKVYRSESNKWVDKYITLDLITDNMKADLDVTAEHIKSTVSKATSKYDLSETAMQDKLPSVITDLSKVKFGYGYPYPDSNHQDAPNNYKPSDFNGEYYFDQETGQFYKSNGSAWSAFGNPMPLLSGVLIEYCDSEILQEADRIVHKVGSAVRKYDTGKYTEVQSPVPANLSTYYEKKGDSYCKTIDTSIISGKKYYTRTEYNITLYGYDDPSSDKTTVSGYKASDYASNGGSYYLNQSNGKLYHSESNKWEHKDTLYLIVSNMASEISQTADKITHTVGAATDKYDYENYPITLFGYENPSASDNTTVAGYTASAYNDEYYLNQNDGGLYHSVNNAWAFVKTLRKNVWVLNTQIEQTAKTIKETVSESVSKYDTGKYEEVPAADRRVQDIDTYYERVNGSYFKTLDIALDSSKRYYTRTDYTIHLCGYGDPDANGYSPIAKAGKNYLDQSNGYLYQAYADNGGHWQFVVELPLLKTVLRQDYETQITQTAEYIKHTAAKAVDKYDLGNYTAVTSPNISNLSSYYELVDGTPENGKYCKTTDTNIKVGKTYYTRQEYVISAWGYGTPDDMGVNPAKYINGYYLNQDNGKLYMSDGSRWYDMNVTLGLQSEKLFSQILQTADGIVSEVSKSISKYSPVVYAEVQSASNSYINTYYEYESVGDFYRKTRDTSVQSGKTYYKRSEYSIDYHGYGLPQNNGYAASGNNDKYYLNQENGDLYKSNGTAWSLVVTLQEDRTQFGTRMVQSAESFKYTWNSISDYISMEDAEIRIYKDEKTGENDDDKLLMSITKNGAEYYCDGDFIGKIGTSNLGGTPTAPHYDKGLTFNLAKDAGFIAWTHSGTNAPTGGGAIKMAYYGQDDAANNVINGMFFDCDVDYRHILRLTRFERWNNVGFQSGVSPSSSKEHAIEVRHYADPTDSGNFVAVNTDNLTSSNMKYYYELKNGFHVKTEDETPVSGKTYYTLKHTSFIVGDDIDFERTLNELVTCDNNLLFTGEHGVLNLSDARLKTNIRDTQVNALETINNISVKSFDWIESKEHDEVGLVAQQLQEIAPELVNESSVDGKLSIKTDKIIPYLIGAIQQLAEIIKTGNTGALSSLSNGTRNGWSDPYTTEEKNDFINSINRRREDI